MFALRKAKLRNWPTEFVSIEFGTEEMLLPIKEIKIARIYVLDQNDIFQSMILKCFEIFVCDVIWLSS